MDELQNALLLEFRQNTEALAAFFWHEGQKLAEKKPTIYILPHHRADGDAVGSAFALQIALERLGWQATAVMAETVPELYEYLDLPEHLVCPTETEAQTLAQKLRTENAYVCLVDNSAPETRLGARSLLWQTASEDRRFIIDHHVSDFAANSKFDIAAEEIACSGMVTELLLLLEAKCQQKLIDKQVAACLMTGIITDSGQLSYAATSKQTYLLMAILKDRGADQELINRLHYHTMSQAKMRIIALAFSQTEFHYDKRCLVAQLSAKQILEAQARDVDIDGISSMLREVAGVDIAVLLRSTQKGNVLGSIRSTEQINCQPIAKELGGGGHERASGFTLYGLDLDTAKKKFLLACQNALGCENAEQ